MRDPVVILTDAVLAMYCAPEGPAAQERPMTEAEALWDVCETALYWAATPTTIKAVRTLLPDLVDEILEGL